MVTTIPHTMKAVRLHPPGGVDDLVFEDVDTPTPDADEVLVRIHAAAITRDELQWPADRLPAIPSYELSGTVAAIGQDAPAIEVGQAVYALTAFDRDGVAAEFAAVPAQLVAVKPESLTHVEAAAVPLPALSAMQGLFDYGRLETGQRVLIHGVGGVGHYALQLARLHGAYVIATASGGRVDVARNLGADEVIDHTTADFTDLDPVALVFDTAGGQRLLRSAEVLEPGGRLISVAEDPPRAVAAEHAVDAAYFLVQPNRRQLDELTGMLDRGQLRPLVDRTYDLAAAHDAFAHTLDRTGRGKVVLTVAGGS